MRHSVLVVISTAVVLVSAVVCHQAAAQSGGSYHTYGPGVSLISVPFDYTNDDATMRGNPCLVFGLSTLSPPKTDFDVMTWLVGSFHAYPNLPADKIKPGAGYFLYSPTQGRSVTASDPVVALESAKPDPFAINLYPGWNMIGAPYHGAETAYSVRLYGDAVGVIAGGSRYSIRDAVSSGIIKAGMWAYFGGRYELSYTIDEWKGYWIKAYQSCQLVIGRAETTRSGASGIANAEPTQLADVWARQIVARAGAEVSDSIQFGVSRDGSDGWDRHRDIEKPPAVTAVPYVYVSFPHPEWQSNAGNYGADIRGRGAGKGWEFTVDSNVYDKDIVLTWPGMGSLPRDVNLVLIDCATGASRSLRTGSGYQFRMAAGSSPRRFRIEMAAAGEGLLRISGLSVTGGRGASRSIGCSLSRSASVDVVVKSAGSGRVVRTVARGATRAAGLNQFVWDCRTDDGGPVPAGVYVCEVRAAGEDGQVVRAVALTTVAR